MTKKLLTLLAVLALAGCATSPVLPEICPQTGFIENADRAPFFDGDKVIVRATIAGFGGDCRFAKQEKGETAKKAEIDLTVPFVARRSAESTQKSIELPYFIAVLSPDEQVLQRQAFRTVLTFNKDGHAEGEESHRVVIPVPAGAPADAYKLAVGFALTPDQLKYNEERK